MGAKRKNIAIEHFRQFDALTRQYKYYFENNYMRIFKAKQYGNEFS